MTTEQVEKLHNDDEVYWNDPDEGICSHQIKIANIWLNDKNGNYLECLAEELS